MNTINEIVIGQKIGYLEVIGLYVPEVEEIDEEIETNTPTPETPTDPPIEEEIPTEPPVTLWKCKCLCGRETIVSDKHLKNATVKSCGCTENKTFLKLINYAPMQNNKKFVNCRCICGKNIQISENDFLARNIVSCGCMNSTHERKKHDLIYTIKHPFKGVE